MDEMKRPMRRLARSGAVFTVTSVNGPLRRGVGVEFVMAASVVQLQYWI